MSAHTHTTVVPGCYRCELNADEVGIADEARAALIEYDNWDESEETAHPGTGWPYVRALLAEQASRKVEAAPSDTDWESLTDKELWDFAGDLLELWNIEDLNPPSLSEQFRDRFVARFGASQPVQVEVTDEMSATVARFIAEAVKNSDQPGFDAFHTARAALTAALGGGE